MTSLDSSLALTHFRTLAHVLSHWEIQKSYPSALLITGDESSQKRNFALALARWIFCKNKAETPCDTCSACQKAISGNWIDFYEIVSEDSESSTDTLKIDAFRRLKQTQGFSGFDQSYKIIFIDHAERMTPQAQNALLKMLEEPPKDWIFLLTCSDSTLLLPTVVSRCQKLRLSPLDLDESTHLTWTDVPPAEEQDPCQSFWISPQTDYLNCIDWMAQKDENFQIFLDRALSLCHYRLKLFSQPEQTQVPLKGNLKSILKNQEKELAFWLERAENIFDCRLSLQTSVNRKLLAQNLLTPWL